MTFPLCPKCGKDSIELLFIDGEGWVYLCMEFDCDFRSSQLVAEAER